MEGVRHEKDVAERIWFKIKVVSQGENVYMVF